MTNFVTAREYINFDHNNLPQCFEEMLNDIEKSINRMAVVAAVESRSASFKKNLADSLPRNSNLQLGKTSVLDVIRLAGAGATLELDGRQSCSRKCGTKHVLGLVLCLNNRETIGTNFLKLEVFSRNSRHPADKSEYFDENRLGVMVTFSRELLKLGKWDPSYADSTEYSFSFKNAYSQILNSKIVLIKVNII
jgi:hypothetical protein